MSEVLGVGERVGVGGRMYGGREGGGAFGKWMSENAGWR